MQLQGQVGQPSPQSIAPGTPVVFRQGQMGDIIVSELHGKYYEAAYRNALFGTGVGVTALSANTITLVATTTPIIGVWNPLASSVNLVIAKAKLQIAVAGNSAVAPGGFIWATSANNGAITTGAAPVNRKTWATTGSQAKGFNPSIALTGLTNNLVILEAAAFATLVAAQGATASPLIGPTSQEEFDGSFIVPPGGVLALLNTVSTTTVSVSASLSWEEVPI